MRKLPWERRARIHEVREQIWTYVSPSSQREGPGLVVAASMLGWPDGDVAELAALQFLLSAEVRDFVHQLPDLARRLSTTSVHGQERSTERIRGAVNWGQTLSGRLANGDRHLHVTTPVERAYQTAENELLVHVLDAVVRLATATGWDKPHLRSEPATTIRTHLTEAKRWQSSSMLTPVKRVAPTPRALARIASGRAHVRYGSVLAAYGRLDALVERLDRDAIRSAIEDVGLVTTQSSILFELLTLFRVIAALEKHGWQLLPLRLFHGAVETHGTRSDGRGIELWYQPKAPVLGEVSRYREILEGHGFKASHDLRPDFVLRWQSASGAQRTLMIECKLSTTDGVEKTARGALFDLLAYRQAFGQTPGEPYGLGVAWGAGLAPRRDREIMLCTPDKIEEALSVTA